MCPTLALICEENTCDGNGTDGWITEAELLNLEKNCQFPDDPEKIQDVQIHSVDTQ